MRTQALSGCCRRTRISRNLAVTVCFFGSLLALGCGRPERESPGLVTQAVTISTWTAGVSYAVGDLATFNGITYRARQAHTAQLGSEPPVAPALWDRPGPAGINPWQNQTAYVLGSGVTYDGLVYRCIQAHTSQPDWTPPAVPTLWRVTGNVQIPVGVSGSLAFVFKAKNLPVGITNGFGLIQRDPFADAAYTELLNTSARSVGEVFHRMQVQGGEVLELFLQANKTKALTTPSMSAATYSSDPTMNMAVDPTFPDHVGQPLQTPAQKAAHIWSLRWESFKFGDPGRDGAFNDLEIELRLEAPCGSAQAPCPDPNLVVSSHNATVVDYRGDFSVPVAPPVAGVAAGPVKDPTGGEGSVTPLGSTVFAGGRLDTLRWSYVQESTDFSAATPAEAAACSSCVLPPMALLGGGLWNLEIKRIHRPRAESWVSSLGPGVFTNFDAKLLLQPGGLGNQNTVVFFDPHSDAPPVTFFELSQQGADAAVDGRYHDNGARMYAGLVLRNASGAIEPNPFSATEAVITRHTGELIKFDIINTQGAGATELQGRLRAIENRNGNITTIAYQFAASSSDAQLGGDRKKLWLINQVSDPHGVAATFQYQLRVGTSRWVVQSISLPDGTSTQYQYGMSGTNLDRLVRVVHANGDNSDFSRTWDAATQSWALSFQDAMTNDVRTWKTVYVTGSTYTTPDQVVHNQEPNLVRRIVNADGEQVYRAIEDPNDPNTTYFREGENRITRLKIDASGLPREVARATTHSADPLAATYTVVESYTGDVLGMIQKATDAFGNVRTFGRDSKTRSITSVTARGGTTATFTLNSFLQPTRTVDRLGRITDVSYDVKGNPIAITHGVGTAVQAAWTYLYNSRGQVTKVTDANGKATDYGYNAAGFLTSITEPADVPGGSRAVRTFAYTTVGRLLASVDASGRQVTFGYDGRGRLITTTYPDATTETLAYGSGPTAGLVVSSTDRNGVVEQYGYDSTRRLASTVRAFGRPEQTVTTFEYLDGTELVAAQVTAGERVEIGYDERQRPVTRKAFINGTASLTSQTAWDSLSRPIVETDPYGRRLFRVYDANGRAVRTVRELVPGGVPAGANISSLPRVTTPNPPYMIDDSTSDAMNQYISTTDARGFVTVQSFDAQGRRVEIKQAAATAVERKTTFEYDLGGNLTKEIHPRTFREGQVFQTVHSYTGRNLLASTTEASGTAEAATTSYTYTLTGKQLTVTDPRGGVTTFGYDVCCDRLASKQDAAGFTTTFGYDGVGNRTSITKPNTATTGFLYDGHRRLVRQTDPLSEITEHTYDDDLTDGIGLDATYGDLIGPLGFGGLANGSATRTVNAAGESNVTVRDGIGRVTLAINASRNPTRTTYDAVVAGLLETAVTDPLGHVTRRRDDGAGRTRTSIDAADKVTARTFDAVGGVLSERDPNGVGQDCMYDAVGRRTACADTQGDTTLFEHDAAGNQIATTDATGVRTTCTFDFRNRRKSCTNGVGATTTHGYDGNSNVTSITDGEGRTTTYTYDARNLKLTETYPDSSGAADKVTMTYDAVGRLATRIDQAGSTTAYSYDLADRLQQKTDAEGQADSFDYDDVGRLTSGTSQRYGTELTRAFDSGGRLSGESITLLANEESYNVSYAYDAADRLTTLTYPDGSAVAQTHTNRDQLASISLGAQSIAQYLYDDAGRLTTTTLGNGRVESRTYRNDGLLSAVSTPGVGDFSYTYDGKKRKLTEGGTAVNGAQTFSYDDQGRLTAWNGGVNSQGWTLSLEGDWQSTTRNGVTENRTHNLAHELTGIGGNNLSYDARGNLTLDDLGNTLAWDFDNKLVGYAAGQGSVVGYLYDVLGRKVARMEGAVTTVFVHAEQEVIAEYDNADLRIKYILGKSIDKPVAYVLGGATHWYSANHLGSIAAVTDTTGAVVERYRYDAHGTRSVLTPTGQTRVSTAVGNQIGFTGRYHDSGTGLLDFRFRQFNPRLGRFISRDDAYRDGMLLYGAYFVPNATDPTGHFIGIIQSILGRKKNSQPSAPPVPGVAVDITSGIFIACLYINACKDRAGQGLNLVVEWAISDILNSSTGSLGGPSNIDTSGWTTASPNQPQAPPVPVSPPGAMEPPPAPNYGGVDSGRLPSSAQIAAVRDAMAKGDRQGAIRLAADAWGIAGASNATYNPFINPTRAGNTTPTGTVQIGPAAFVDPLTNMPRSAGFLASTLAHEAVHVHQVNTGNYAQTGTLGEKVNEIEGYDRELRELPRFGMSPSEIQETRGYRNDLYQQVTMDPFYKTRITDDPHSPMNNYLIRSDELYRY